MNHRRAEVDCRIRPFAWSDLDTLTDLANNPKIASQLRDAFPHPYTREDALSWLHHATQAGSTVFAIETEGRFAGGIGYHPGKDIERCSAEVGYWLGEPFWGKGLAAKALGLLVEQAQKTSLITRLFALPFAENAASQKVLQKAGFSFEAVLRRAAIKAGIIRDLHLYGLTLEESPGA